MYSNLIKTSTVDMSLNDWLLFRKDGIGASEVASVLNENEYKSALEVFEDKINPNIIQTPDNLSMYLGRLLEDSVSQSYKYYDGDEKTMLLNAANNNVINDVFRSNMYIQNPDFPHLFVSLDRRIRGKNGALECKTMRHHVWRKEETIPFYYILQATQQAGVCGFDYVDVAILIEFHGFVVFRIELRQNIFNNLVECTFDFWQRVLKARKYKTQIFEAELNFNEKLKKEIEAKLMHIEPEPVATISYSDFIGKKFENATGFIKDGNVEMLNIAIEHRKTKDIISKLSKNALYYENILKNDMRENVELNFGKDGKVTWKKNKNGSRIFKNLIK